MEKESIMKPRNRLTKIANHMLLIAMILLTFSLSRSATEAYAKNDTHILPLLREFIETVTNGEAGVLRGIYIPNLLALRVAQQPGEDSRFISNSGTIVTQFNMAARMGNVGLLAHNYLAGNLFFEIQVGNEIILIFGNGRMENFTVNSVNWYEALPHDAYKDFVTGDVLNTGELYDMMYNGEYHLTLQTCIEWGDNPDWGRLFIIAQPVDRVPKAEKSEPLIVLGWPLTLSKPDVQPAITNRKALWESP
jgi:hypothetical protein